MNTTSYITAAAGISLLSVGAWAQTSTNSTPPDNSSTNKMESHVDNSADAQKNDHNDVSLTRQIRRSVIADKSLSTYAHNVKIVTVDGTVTLNGVVRSDQERTSVEAKAVSIAGKDRVVDQLTIATPRS